MAKYTESVCRLCRREMQKLFLKGDRCFTDKCAVERRNYPPGEHGTGRSRFTEYGNQLRAKQKVKRMYGLMEKQFHGYFKRAERMKGVTGNNLLILLESRLDNMVYRMGFATSRAEARQLVCHGHFRVDGRKVDRPSYVTRPGQVIDLRERSRSIARIQEAVQTATRRGVPKWLELDAANYKGVVAGLPSREDLTMPIEEQLIVELYSR